MDKLQIPYQVKSNLATYKELDESGRTIKAVANTYNFYDYDGDVLRMGAAKKSIEDFKFEIELMGYYNRLNMKHDLPP